MHSQLLHRLTHRPANANKYDFGHVLIFGGSPGMVGAPLLAGEAALRMGAGLVTIASDAHTVGKLERRVAEIMTLALPDYAESEQTANALLTFAQNRKVTAVAIGPGLQPQAAATVRLVAERFAVPIVLDAGGLAAFQNHLPLLQHAVQTKPVIITPHSGEFARLTDEIPANFVKKYRTILVLKGHPSVVHHPDGTLYTNTTGNPGLATAGTGDVLTGVIAALLAQGATPLEAAETGVYLHGLAGDLAATAKGVPGIIASDVIQFLPAAIRQNTI